MSKFASGVYTPKNSNKYIGKGLPHYRSGWELKFMVFLDNHPGIKQWVSESIYIPYKCPFTGKSKNYIPDFLIIYETKDGTKKAEIVEIKPEKETGLKKINSQRNALIVAKNQAKWAAAKAYCDSQGLNFRIITENQLFGNGKKNDKN